jgi:hypothetical protein
LKVLALNLPLGSNKRHNQGHRSFYMALTLLQPMRLNNSFADFTVLGSQYENDDGIREWHVAIWSELYQDPDLLDIGRP